jgi:hypothetical protein
MSEPRARLEPKSPPKALIRLLLGPLGVPVASFGSSSLQKRVRLRADRGYLQAMLREMPFQAIGIDNEKQLSDYDTGAAELRTDELMRVAAGLPVPGLDALNDLRYPEPAQ